MRIRTLRRLPDAVMAMAIALLVAGCGGSSGASGGSPLDVPSLEPPAPSFEPSFIVQSRPAPTPEGSLSEPPGARIATGATSAVDGVLGSWTLDDIVSDHAWIPASELERMDFPSSELVFAGWADGTPIGAWSVRVAEISDTTGAEAIDAGSGSGNGADFVTIGRIAAGTWVLEVTLERADGRGEATYYWEILAT